MYTAYCPGAVSLPAGGQALGTQTELTVQKLLTYDAAHTSNGIIKFQNPSNPLQGGFKMNQKFKMTVTTNQWVMSR